MLETHGGMMAQTPLIAYGLSLQVDQLWLIFQGPHLTISLYILYVRANISIGIPQTQWKSMM